MLRNQSEAEDLTQDAFLVVLQKLNTFRGDSAFSTWLHRVTVNAVLMHLRKKQAPRGELAKPDDPELAIEIEIPCTDYRLEGLLDRVRLNKAVVC
jgi:RNA polymerase sigma-70 factor, ECF subfamily